MVRCRAARSPLPPCHVQRRQVATARPMAASAPGAPHVHLVSPPTASRSLDCRERGRPPCGLSYDVLSVGTVVATGSARLRHGTGSPGHQVHVHGSWHGQPVSLTGPQSAPVTATTTDPASDPTPRHRPHRPPLDRPHLDERGSWPGTRERQVGVGLVRRVPRRRAVRTVPGPRSRRPSRGLTRDRVHRHREARRGRKRPPAPPARPSPPTDQAGPASPQGRLTSRSGAITAARTSSRTSTPPARTATLDVVN